MITEGVKAAGSSELEEPGIDHEALGKLAPEFVKVISARAATWEVEFDGGPGEVCSVSDAAWVLARYVLENQAACQEKL